MITNMRVSAGQVAFIAYCGIFLFGCEHETALGRVWQKLNALVPFADDTGVAGGVVGLKSFSDSFGYTNKSKTEITAIKSWIVSILMLGAYGWVPPRQIVHAH